MSGLTAVNANELAMVVAAQVSVVRARSNSFGNGEDLLGRISLDTRRNEEGKREERLARGHWLNATCSSHKWRRARFA